MLRFRDVKQLPTLLVALLLAGLSNISQADELSDLLTKYQQQQQTLQNVAFSPTGGFNIILGKNGYFNRNIPDEAHQEMTKLANQGHTLKLIAFAPNGGWSILYDKNGHFNRNIPDEAHQQMILQAKNGQELKCIAFTAKGGFSLLYGKNGFLNRGIPDATHARMTALNQQNASIDWVAFTPTDGWSVISNQTGYENRGIPDAAHQAIVAAANQRQPIKRVTFGPGGSWGVLFGKNGFKLGTATLDPAQLKTTLAGYLQQNNVPGASVAVIKSGKVVFASGVGLARTSTNTAVTPQTLFQAASLSKPVTALVALRFVDANLITLTDPVNNQLRSWKVPANNFTQTRQVTLAQLLSHTGGLNVGGFAGYSAGNRVPTLLQILNGQPPANSAAIRVTTTPGTAYSYSGGGYTILQQLLNDVSQRPFATLMQEQLLTPLQMTSSTFQQPLPQRLQTGAAVGYDQNGNAIPGNWNTHPEQAAAGLWTTPSDLTKFVIAVQSAVAGNPGALLKQSTARQMLQPQIANGPGLGLFVTGNSFSHSGSNVGYRCILRGNTASGDGIVIMTNSNNGAAFYNQATTFLTAQFGLQL